MNGRRPKMPLPTERFLQGGRAVRNAMGAPDTDGVRVDGEPLRRVPARTLALARQHVVRRWRVRRGVGSTVVVGEGPVPSGAEGQRANREDPP